MSGFSPENSAIKLSPEQEKHVAGLQSVSEIQVYLEKVATGEEGGGQPVYRHDWSKDYRIPVDQPAAQQYAKTITINGKDYRVEGTSEIDVERAVGALYKSVLGQGTPQPTRQVEQPRNERGQFAAATEQVSAEQKAGLDLQFQLGQITTAEYIERSGAVGDYLAKQGVPVEDLKAAVSDRQDSRLEKSWESATKEFMASAAGNDWVGGDENLATVNRILNQEGLAEKPSADTLADVWNYMKQNPSLIAENPDLTARDQDSELEDKINQSTSQEEIRNLARSSSMFGR